jgi:hypothetical protein
MRSIFLALIALKVLVPFTEAYCKDAICRLCIDANNNEIDCAIFDLADNDDSFLDDSADDNVAEWDCDIRSWTRAPDLIPGHQIPGETRLWVNGTGCKDIELWELGLRLKERAIVKVRYVFPHIEVEKRTEVLKRRDYNVDFPLKPERKPFNASAHMNFNGPDMNDIYTGREYGGYFTIENQDEKEYQGKMDEYSESSSTGC